MKKIILILILISPLVAFGQNNPLSIFDNLVAKTWKAEGKWGDGSQFKQELSINYSLDSSIVTVNAVGFIDEAKTTLGLRNHGVRQFDRTTKEVKFWEFDVFGGRTEGIVIAEGKDIVYQYKYGDSVVTDMWEYVDDFNYNFKVGNYKDGEWKQIYLSTKFTAQKKTESSSK